MAWRRLGDKPWSEPMMVSLLKHICATRPQWVKDGLSIINFIFITLIIRVLQYTGKIQIFLNINGTWCRHNSTNWLPMVICYLLYCKYLGEMLMKYQQFKVLRNPACPRSQSCLSCSIIYADLASPGNHFIYAISTHPDRRASAGNRLPSKFGDWDDHINQWLMAQDDVMIWSQSASNEELLFSLLFSLTSCWTNSLLMCDLKCHHINGTSQVR